MLSRGVIRAVLVLVLAVLSSTVYSGAIDRPDFTSYEKAIIWVRSNDNLTKDSVDTSKSSWIRAAEYYTDSSGYGFLILNMKGKEYIWEDVPIEVWTGF